MSTSSQIMNWDIIQSNPVGNGFVRLLLHANKALCIMQINLYAPFLLTNNIDFCKLNFNLKWNLYKHSEIVWISSFIFKELLVRDYSLTYPFHSQILLWRNFFLIYNNEVPKRILHLELSKRFGISTATDDEEPIALVSSCSTGCRIAFKSAEYGKIMDTIMRQIGNTYRIDLIANHLQEKRIEGKRASSKLFLKGR